jgi:signal peptidase I
MEPNNYNPVQAPQTPPPNPGTPVYITPSLPETPPPEPKGEGVRAIISTVAILIAAPIIALLLTTYVFQSYEVDGPSMETTLENHDRLLVLKVPKTIASLTGKDYVPNRNEIIIFKTNTIQDGSLDSDGEKQLVKRVIGIPGDRVVVKDGEIRVFNAQFPEGFDPDAGQDHGDSVDVTSGDVDITVEEGEVFVCGDNRANSLDSRAIGTIPSKDIIGKLSLRLYPLDTIRKF